MNDTQIKERAKASLDGCWGTMIGMILISMLVSGILGGTSGFLDTSSNSLLIEVLDIIGSFIENMLTIGLAMACLRLVRKSTPGIEDLFYAFQDFPRYAKLALVYTALDTVIGIPNLLIDNTFFNSIWLVVSVIVTTVITYRISITKYLMIDHTELSFMDAMKKSNELMTGNCIRLFGLQLSFIGWFIVGIITCGIGFLYVSPYMEVAVTVFYQDVVGELSE